MSPYRAAGIEKWFVPLSARPPSPCSGGRKLASKACSCGVRTCQGHTKKGAKMIEEMSEAGELRVKLQWLEHDLEHVVVERDRAAAKLNDIWDIVNEYFGPAENWTRPMDGRSVMSRVRKSLIQI